MLQLPGFPRETGEIIRPPRMTVTGGCSVRGDFLEATRNEGQAPGIYREDGDQGGLQTGMRGLRRGRPREALPGDEPGIWQGVCA